MFFKHIETLKISKKLQSMIILVRHCYYKTLNRNIIDTIYKYSEHIFLHFETAYIPQVHHICHKWQKVNQFSLINPSPDSLLITLDVDSLYTNINNQDGFEAVKESFKKHPDPKHPDEQILDLLKICLENNDFIFNDEQFLQVGGTAIGKKSAPNYANLSMFKQEQ